MLILIGHNDTPYLTTGWHPPQDGPAGIPCRWMSQHAEIEIEASAAVSADGPPVSQISITISAPDEIRNMKPGLTVYTGDTFQGHCANLGPEGQWSTAIFPLQLSAPGNCSAMSGSSRIKISLAIELRNADTVTPLAFVPHEILQNGDLRELGALISSIRLS